MNTRVLAADTPLGLAGATASAIDSLLAAGRLSGWKNFSQYKILAGSDWRNCWHSLRRLLCRHFQKYKIISDSFFGHRNFSKYRLSRGLWVSSPVSKTSSPSHRNQQKSLRSIPAWLQPGCFIIKSDLGLRWKHCGSIVYRSTVYSGVRDSFP